MPMFTCRQVGSARPHHYRVLGVLCTSSISCAIVSKSRKSAYQETRQRTRVQAAGSTAGYSCATLIFALPALRFFSSLFRISGICAQFQRQLKSKQAFHSPQAPDQGELLWQHIAMGNVTHALLHTEFSHLGNGQQVEVAEPIVGYVRHYCWSCWNS